MNKRNGFIVGLLFIIGTVAGIASLPSLGSIAEAGFLQTVAENPSSLTIGALLIALMSVACTGIAIGIYPVIKSHRPGLALAAVVFRSLEGAIFLSAVVYLLPIGALVQDLSGAALGQADVLQRLFDASGGPAGIAFSIGAFMYYLAFFQLRAIPRWLSGWGIIAITMHLVATILVMSGVGSFTTGIIILNVPIALQEMVLAVWLIIKGFNVIKSKKEGSVKIER